MTSIRWATRCVALSAVLLCAACNSIIGAGEATVAASGSAGNGGFGGTGGGGAGGLGGASGRGGTGGSAGIDGGTAGTGGAGGIGGADASAGGGGSGGTGGVQIDGSTGGGGTGGTGGLGGASSVDGGADADGGGTGGSGGTGGKAGSGGSPGTGGTGGTGGTDAGTFVPLNAQSCNGLALCNGESCCTSINVPGGTFTQGGSPVVAGPAHPSTVSSFALDKYEVTVGRFRKFVAAYVSNTASGPADGAGVNPVIPGTGWQSGWNPSLPATQAAFMDTSHLKCNPTYQTWTDTAGTADQESRAINCVDWYGAFAFCIWDGGRLATESEWEYAAAGGAENRLYPWGSAAPDCTYANFLNGYYCSGGSGSVVAVGSTLAGNGKWGHADLAGNVWEWVFDWYAAYSGSASNNYANTTASSGRVFRGGYYNDGATYLRAAYRYYSTPGSHYNGAVGARCSRTVQ